MLNNKKIIKQFAYKGEFLSSNHLRDLLYNQKFNNFNDLIEWLDNDSADMISDLADSLVDVYYYDLRKWSADNYNYIEDAVNDFGMDSKKFDFHRVIQLGQYYAYNNEFYEMINKFKQHIQATYKIRETR